MSNLRNIIGGFLLCLLLLSDASAGMRLPRETKAVWQRGKDASYEILKQLEKLDINKPAAFDTTVQFPQPIECSDSCDPDSLATTNRMPCLTKIRQGLRHYSDLLAMFSDPAVPTQLQNALDTLLELPLNGGSGNEGLSPVTRTAVPGVADGPAAELDPVAPAVLWGGGSKSLLPLCCFGLEGSIHIESMRIDEKRQARKL